MRHLFRRRSRDANDPAGVVKPLLPPLIRQVVTFGAASVVGTAAHYAVLVLLVEAVGWSATAATAVGFIVGAVVNYHFARRWTFTRAQTPHREALAKFLAVAASGWVLNTALIYLATARWALPYLPAQIAVTGLLFFWHFGVNRLWTFRR